MMENNHNFYGKIFKLVLSFLLALTASTFLLAGRNDVVISGKIYDKQTGEVLIAANVFSKDLNIGTTSNDQGFYSLKILSLPVLISASYIGYETLTISIDTLKQTYHLYLTPDTKSLDEVVIAGSNNSVKNNKGSVFLLSKGELKTLPSVASEPDLNLFLQQTPGVVNAGDGNSNLYVRGGSHDQNLFLIDNIPLFHVAHFGGFFSTFNADIINSATLYTGGFPSRHGGRLSSVVDIHTYDGDLYEFNGKATLGLMFAKLAINGPIIKGKSSYNLSVRKNLFNYLKLFSGDNIDFGFYDANIKVSTALSKNDKLFFSFYNGNDLFGISDGTDSTGIHNNKISWGNLAGAVRYNKIFSPLIFGNLIAGHSSYYYNEHYLLDNKIDNLEDKLFFQSDFNSKISCEFAKAHLEYNFTNYIRLFTGYEFNLYRFIPGNGKIIEQYPGYSLKTGHFGYENTSSVENNIFGELIFKDINNFSGNIGFRPSLLSISQKSYFAFQPRISLNYALHEKIQLKSSFTKINQAFHVLSSTGIGFSSDYRIPVFDFAPPSESEQFVVGVDYRPDNAFELSAEIYFKNLENLVVKKEGVRYTLNYDSWQKTIETNGLGQARGLEILARKNQGKLTGWLGFTWSNSIRQFEGINYGKPFWFDYDRRFELNCSGKYTINKFVDVGMNWTYATGIPSNIPEWRYDDLDGNTVFLYRNYNGSRQKDYHRLDISINMVGEKGKWNFNIINVYNRRNTYYHQIIINNKQPELREKSLFTILPTISYTFEF